jgi:hypothetical protein
MTEAPDKIWVDYSPHTEGWGDISYAEEHGYTGYTRSDMARAYLADYRAAYEGSCEQVEELQAEVARLRAAHGNLWSALADVMEQPGDYPNATVRRMAAYAEKALVHDTIADVHPVPRFYKLSITT